MSFVHLNVHSHYSVLEALGKPSEYAAKAKKLSQKALAITDSGVLYGAVEFFDICKKKDIKPIIGGEFFVASNGRTDKNPDSRRYSLILFAKNNLGYKNLIKLATKGNLEGFYYVPRIDDEILEQCSEGIIALSSWRYSEITQKLLNNSESEAKEALDKYRKFFGKENFFMEIQNHPEEIYNSEINEKILKFAKENFVSLVGTNGCLYVDSDDKKSFDAFSCIKKGQTVNDENRVKLFGDYSLKSSEEMEKIFDFCPEAYSNTSYIADQIDLKIEFGQNLLPKFETPGNKDPKDYLKELCIEGLYKKYTKERQDEALKRLEYELSIINQMGFASYFLIVQDFVNFAKSRGIIVGPGRGSAAGSMISYCLDITALDPITYNLIFERFLNPERVSMPDIDVDFSDYRRDEVLQYVIEKYGENQVAQIITFGTMAAKAAIRDAGRVLGISYSDVDRIAKMVPDPILGKYKPLKQYLEEAPELKEVYSKEKVAKDVLDAAVRFEGSVRNVGTHACAVVISPDPLINHTPIQRAVGDKSGIVTQYSMKPIEKIGLLKMDFLGLSNLSIMEDTIKLIKSSKDISIDINNIPLDDKKTFDLFKQGKTTGVFQFESPGMKRYLKDLKPTELEDLIAMNSLYRPGPMQFISDYIKGKQGTKKVEYLHSSLEEVLKSTYGIAVYQEQVLKIAQKFAGFTLGEADLLRRAIGKKIAEELAAQRQKFIDGSMKQGHSEKLAVKMFDEVIEPFAGYGFNKAHAACYSYIAYQTAYLKAYYPAYFMAALLTSDSGNTDRIAIEIGECENLGIKVLPPNLNESTSNFTVIDDSTIRFGLSAIKGLGENSAAEIIKVRSEGGKFNSISDFAKRVPHNIVNKKTLEALIYSGAMDDFDDQNTLAQNIETISKFAKNEQQNTSSGQTDLFAMLGGDSNEFSSIKLTKAPPTNEYEKLKREKSYLGIYVSRHPLKGLSKYFKEKVRLMSSITKNDLGKVIRIGGIVSTIRKISTRSNELMLTFVVEDPTASIECVIFPRYFQKVGFVFKDDEVVIMEGKIDERGGKVQFSCHDAKAISLETMIENAKEKNIYDLNEKIEFKGRVSFDSEEEILESAKLFEGVENFVSDKVMEANIEQNKQNDIYIIEISENVSKEKMAELKKLLIDNKSESGISVILKLPKNHEIKVPIKVDVTDKLKKDINSIISIS